MIAVKVSLGLGIKWCPFPGGDTILELFSYIIQITVDRFKNSFDKLNVPATQ